MNQYFLLLGLSLILTLHGLPEISKSLKTNIEPLSQVA